MALKSKGVASPNDRVREELLRKHRQEVPETDGDHALPPRQHSPSAVERFTTLEVSKALSKFPRASAAGGSGLTATHLEELMSVPCTEQDTGLVAGLAKLLTRMARGEAPNAIAPWIAGAPLTALLKSDDSVRPIAVGETLRRLASSILMNRVAKRAKEFLELFQLGVATKRGTEAILHAARRHKEHFRSNRLYALLKLDLKNAFNLVSRAAFIKQVRLNFPELEPWVQYCYDFDSPHLWVGELCFRSVTGVQQGDPLGPLLFSLALHAALTRLSLLLLSEQDSDEESAGIKPMLLQSFYRDDGIIVAKHGKLRQVLDFFDSHEALQYGLHLRLDKCSIWWPTEPAVDVRSAYPPQVQQEYGRGNWILGAPVGTDDYVRQATVKYVQTLAPLTKAIRELEDMQVALTLLRHCAGACKIVYLLRTVPTTLVLEAASLFDDLLQNCLRDMVGGSLSPDVFRELQLPLNTSTPGFGIGLTSTKDTASSAFLASLGLVRSLHVFMLEGAIPAGDNGGRHGINAYNDWRAGANQNVDLSWDFISSTNCPSQRALAKRVPDAPQQRLPIGDHCTQAFRASLGVTGTKDWLKTQPSPGLGTHIQDRDFRLRFKYYCRIALFNGDEQCPRKGCPTVLDEHGDHLLHCPNRMRHSASPRIWRHNSQVRLLCSDLRNAARQPVLEPREGGQHPSRPDIRTLGATGGSDYLDVTIVHPLSSQTSLPAV